MVGLLVSPFAHNTNSRKLHPYQGKIRSKKGAYKGGGGNKTGITHRRGEIQKKINTEQKQNNKTSIGPAIGLHPCKKKKTQNISFHRSRHLHHLRSCWKTKSYGGTEAKESSRKSHTQTRGTTALQASSPSPEAGTPILHPVLHSKFSIARTLCEGNLIPSHWSCSRVKSHACFL